MHVLTTALKNRSNTYLELSFVNMTPEILAENIKVKIGEFIGGFDAEFRTQTFRKAEVILFQPILSVLLPHGLTCRRKKKESQI